MYIYSIDLEEDANRVRDDGADTEDKCTRRSENDNEAKEVGEQEVAVHVQAPTFTINIIQCNDIDCKQKKVEVEDDGAGVGDHEESGGATRTTCAAATATNTKTKT